MECVSAGPRKPFDTASQSWIRGQPTADPSHHSTDAMPKKFDDIQVGDQLELPASRGAIIYAPPDPKFDPDRPVRVAIVTHVWFDPVDAKEYVGLAYLRKDGSYGKPVEKRTITGLARCGWRKARQDWITVLEASHQTDTVVRLWDRR